MDTVDEYLCTHGMGTLRHAGYINNCAQCV